MLPDNVKDHTNIQRCALRYYYNMPTKTPNRKSSDGVLLRCISQKEAKATLEEVHAGLCGTHQAGSKLHNQIRRLGYYWLTMVINSI